MNKVTEFAKIQLALKTQREFDCDRILGEGAYGIVVNAKCTKEGEHQGKTFAIKIMTYDEGDKKTMKYQRRELESLFRLKLSKDSNVIKYFKSWVMLVGHEQKLCIQMELCSVNLGTFVNQNKIIIAQKSPRFYRQVFREILNGLDFIHLAGWVHRDIHPGNILIVNPNPQRINDIHVKIGDFGYARYIGIELELSSEYNINAKFQKLTPIPWDGSYTAPELKTNTYDTKVDIYSAGVVLYFISCYPVQLDNSILKSEVDAITQGKRDINECIYHKDDEKLSRLIKQMLQEKPNKRPSARDAKECIFPEAKDSTETQEIQFYAKKENEKYSRVCSLNKLTFSALRAEVERRTHVKQSRQELTQERTNDGKLMYIIIECDEDVEFIFQNAAQEGKEGRYVELIVIEKAEDNSNIETGQISSGDITMESPCDPV